MLVLALDTATPVVTAAVVRLLRPHELIDPAGTAATSAPQPTAPRPTAPISVLAEANVDDAFAHAERLLPLAESALAQAGVELGQLDAIVVGVGPGPFTGLRVGIATAAALGDALGISVYPVPSHLGTALGAEVAEPFLVVTDARRREVYVSAFAPGSCGALRTQAGPEVLRPADLAAFCATLPQQPTAVAGAGAVLAGLDLPELPAGSAGLGLVRAAARDLLTGAVPAPPVPLYLRRPDVTEPSASKSVLA
ncbi:tRNA (adenosine(37)-N6)-threonylcarbamoyltransferase complex dimerization subunit type 1 TsaB [Nakamurella aerolata]|uniref:tRNA (Adenosine(37)-N6)-threonylcarbamoyltransferase complex dimerization subunit type 1 TsaB n=1 Tax=Nakamurella aerolata TaxID=1656892 RepID=A0A849A8F2_9ACTN|nr:tRNA (adenosine(37)-N6)-threonylcarbamoyltransferase complex dimerization subunit type 1 TsaB [Nakamurella aerolata]NNG35896.1 tRNA (adenosine(37)-N6)-threonylcarbamoyltransferase complex dimerization subunit type 1 TsaB [Nakamurella aerolata]